MGLRGTDLNLAQKFQENKILKKLNFEFCLSFKSVPGQPPFPTTQNPKKLFPICLNMFRNPKIYPKESSISILLYKNLKIIFHVLNNNFSYTQLFLFFFFRKISISIPMLLTLFYSERSLYLSRAFYLVFSFFF